MVTVQVFKCRKLGLEIFKVYLNGTYVTEFPSVQMARTKAMELSNKYGLKI